MKCPSCGNNYCRIIADSKTEGKDYSILSGLFGELLFGSSGFALGFSNSRNTKVETHWICKKCGYKFDL